MDPIQSDPNRALLSGAPTHQRLRKLTFDCCDFLLFSHLSRRLRLICFSCVHFVSSSLASGAVSCHLRLLPFSSYPEPRIALHFPRPTPSPTALPKPIAQASL